MSADASRTRLFRSSSAVLSPRYVSGAEVLHRSRVDSDCNKVEKPAESSSSPQLGSKPSCVNQEHKHLQEMLSEQLEWQHRTKQHFEQVEETIKRHSQCHEEAFTAITSEMKKRSEQQSFMQMLDIRIDEMCLRIGRLEEGGNLNQVNVEPATAALQSLQTQQTQLKQLMTKQCQELQRLSLQNPGRGHSKEKVGFDVSTDVSSSQQTLGLVTPYEDYETRSGGLVDSSTYSCEGSESTGKLSLLLKNIQEERTFVVEMLESIRQEKLDVVAATRTFQLEKANAMQEIKATQNNKAAPQGSMRKDQVVESNQKILSQISPLSPGRMAAPWRSPRGLSVNVPAIAASVRDLSPTVYVGHASGSVSAIPLTASCSRSALGCRLLPRAPSSEPHNARDVKARTRAAGSAEMPKPSLTPRIV